MFNKKNKTNKKVSKNQQTSPSLTMISEGTKIKGSLSSKNDIRVSGNLDGEINCKSRLIITSTAEVEGDVYSVDADISGTVDGSLRVSNKLILRQNANVGGDVYTKTLVVEEGAQLNGACKMGDSIKEPEDEKYEKVKDRSEKIASTASA